MFWINEYFFPFCLVLEPLSRPETSLSVTRKSVCEKDPDLSVSAVVQAVQIENEFLQGDVQRQAVATAPQKVWQKKEELFIQVAKPPWITISYTLGLCMNEWWSPLSVI